MDYLNKDSLLYIGLIVLFLAYFLWNKGRGKKSRNNLKSRSFRRRFEERKRERRAEENEDHIDRNPL